MTGRMTPIVRTPSTPGQKPGSKRPPGSGRPPGVPNKTTAKAREAIAMFVDGNVHRLTGWLDQVANGVLLTDKDGNTVYDDDGLPVYISGPNPEKAFNLFQSVIEYHVPKLARSEFSGVDGNPINLTAVDLQGLTDDELQNVLSLLSKASKVE